MDIDLYTCRIPATDFELDALLDALLADKVPQVRGHLANCAVRTLSRRAGAIPPEEVAPRIAAATVREFHYGCGVDHPESVRTLEHAYAAACGCHTVAGKRYVKARIKAETSYRPTEEIAARLRKAEESAKSALTRAASRRDAALLALNAALAEWERGFRERAGLPEENRKTPLDFQISLWYNDPRQGGKDSPSTPNPNPKEPSHGKRQVRKDRKDGQAPLLRKSLLPFVHIG